MLVAGASGAGIEFESWKMGEFLEQFLKLCKSEMFVEKNFVFFLKLRRSEITNS